MADLIDHDHHDPGIERNRPMRLALVAPAPVAHRPIPVDTRVVVVMVDQVSHGLARKIRRVADQMAVPVVFSKRSVGQLSSALACVTA